MTTSVDNHYHIALDKKSPFLSRELAVRFGLVPVAVAICYLFQWDFLRSLTLDLNLRAMALFGVHWYRISPDVAMFHGHRYEYVISCTMIDAWFGAIPLVWKLKNRVPENLAYLAALAVFTFVLNIIRLTAANLLVSSGVSWFFGHDVIAALSYLIVWVVIQPSLRSPASI